MYTDYGGTLPVVDPTDAAAYLRAIRLVIGGYGVHRREQRREADVAVREEVARASGRVRNHLNNVHDSAYRAGDTDLAQQCALALEEVDSLRNDVELAATGADHPFFSRQKGVSKKTINQLIKHDHNTLDMLRKAVNSSNDLEKVHAEADGGEALEAVRKCQQLVSSCRGHFSERNGVLRGI